MKRALLSLGLLLAFNLTVLSADAKAELNAHLSPFKPWLGKWQHTWIDDSGAKGSQVFTSNPVAGGHAIGMETVVTVQGQVVGRDFSLMFWDEQRQAFVGQGVSFQPQSNTTRKISSTIFLTGKELTIQESWVAGTNAGLVVSKTTLVDNDLMSFQILASYEDGKPTPPEQMWKVQFSRVKD